MEKVYAVAEYNDKGWHIYADNYPGAFVHGATNVVALNFGYERQGDSLILYFSFRK